MARTPARGPTAADDGLLDTPADIARPVAVGEPLVIGEAAPLTAAETLAPPPQPAGAGYILIVSRVAGFRRANVVHPSRAEYPLDYFTANQLRLIREEPMLELIEVGGQAVPSAEEADGPGRPFTNAHGRALLTDGDLRDRAHEAVVGEAVGSADAGIRTRAFRDTARQRLAARGA